MPDFSAATVIRASSDVVLYGAGNVGREVASVLTRNATRVVCMLDRTPRADPQGSAAPVFSPGDCPIPRDQRAGIPAVITVFNRDADVPAIAQMLHDMGFQRVVSFVDLHASLCGQLDDRYWLTNRSVLDRDRQEIAEAANIWSDKQSTRLYLDLIALREYGEYRPSIAPARSIQYLPIDVPHWRDRLPCNLVDCGAYRGDTLETLLDDGVQIAGSVHFEPDPENFAALAEVAARRRTEISGSILLWPCAVGARLETLSFAAGQQEASRVDPAGSRSITSVALDEVLLSWKPTMTNSMSKAPKAMRSSALVG